jgi:hypothetical protein
MGPPSLEFQYWTLDNWGQQLVLCPYLGTIYIWDPIADAGSPAQLITPASGGGYSNNTVPSTNIGIFIAMPEQIMVAYGSVPWASSPDDQAWNPLAICWSSVSDYTVWQPLTTNQAGSFILPSGSAIIKGMQLPQQMLFWTDIELWAAQYIGFPLVFGFNKIGQSCGLIAPNAVAVMNNGIYWMSSNQFFVLNSNGVQPLPCTVWDQIFQNLNTSLQGKIIAAPNTYFNEVAWFFPSNLSTQENDSYVKYNIATGSWDYGTLSRTAWLDQSILGAPIGSDSLATVVQHEQGYNSYEPHVFPNNPTQPLVSWIQTGYIQIAEGDRMTFVDQIWPDIRFGSFPAQVNQTNSADTTKGTVMVTVYMVDFPGDNPRQYGPFPVDVRTQYIPLQARGRQMSIKFSSDDLNLFWRIGMVRYRGQSAGRY